MAITGSGTENDPYIVHSYDEIKQTFRSGGYSRLDNNIDCNGYGENFEWEEVHVGGQSTRSELDLNGHFIKNIKVKANNYMFGTSRDTGNSVIKNGKLLNVFLGGSNGLNHQVSDAGWVTGITFDNISLSANISGTISFPIVLSGSFRNSAVYIEGTPQEYSGGVGSLFFTYGSYNTYIENTDFLFNVQNAKRCMFNIEGMRLKNCRIRGNYGFAPDFGYKYMMWVNYSKYFEDCVVDVDFSNIDNIQHNGTSTSGTVVNKDKIPTSAFSGTDVIQVTSAEIINGDALRSKGFNVVNVLT